MVTISRRDQSDIPLDVCIMKVGYRFCVFLVVEPLEVLSMAYCSYVMAELFHFSGIIRFAFALVVSFCVSGGKTY